MSAEEQFLIKELGRVELVEAEAIKEEQALRKPYSLGVVVCEVDGKENYQKRLLKDLEANQKLIASIEQKFSGDFVKFAKPEIVEKERERLAVAKRALVELTNELQTLNGAVAV
jgi:valyl-tRNA synthetase